MPKLIHPLPPSTPRTPGSLGGGDEIEEDPPTPHPGIADTWCAAAHSGCQPLCPGAASSTCHGVLQWQLGISADALADATLGWCRQDPSADRSRLRPPCRMAALNEERPPTPPRGRPQTHSLAEF